MSAPPHIKHRHPANKFVWMAVFALTFGFYWYSDVIFNIAGPTSKSRLCLKVYSDIAPRRVCAAGDNRPAVADAVRGNSVPATS